VNLSKSNNKESSNLFDKGIQGFPGGKTPLFLLIVLINLLTDMSVTLVLVMDLALSLYMV
jgi:hypothetical protein